MDGEHQDHDARGSFAYGGLDRVLHEKARLGILTALAAAVDGRSFVELKHLCDLTDGNLSRHLRVLEEAGLVEIQKSADGTRTRTTALLTRGGRAQFLSYITELERVIRDARPGESLGDEPGLAPA